MGLSLRLEDSDSVILHKTVKNDLNPTQILNFLMFLFLLSQKQRPKRVKAVYHCIADNPDELTFSEGEVIVVDGEEDQEWWLGHIEGDPMRRGAFPVTFVHFIAD
ncbi:Arf-GAP with SH3 domain, ANK repeat and PH domain-containing protein 2 [Goodea atripinnis]|uniref:Arf-GAP with SH3 domain, ANK repeat and PH domain-containing protein 2 n=1 Tax=Goodea atripinnis TaxID=208336 RepID=A0ABV0NQX6_9TELE